jgi:hypothetical protein
MTGGPQADAHLVIAGLLKSELGVEGSHAINVRLRDAQILGDLHHGFPRDVPALALAILQDRDQLVLLPRKYPEVQDVFFLFSV